MWWCSYIGDIQWNHWWFNTSIDLALALDLIDHCYLSWAFPFESLLQFLILHIVKVITQELLNLLWILNSKAILQGYSLLYFDRRMQVNNAKNFTIKIMEYLHQSTSRINDSRWQLMWDDIGIFVVERYRPQM